MKGWVGGAVDDDDDGEGGRDDGCSIFLLLPFSIFVHCYDVMFGIIFENFSRKGRRSRCRFLTAMTAEG